MKRNILFIINPISGGKSKLSLPGMIDALLDHVKFNPSYTFTEYAGHATELAEEAAQNSFDVVVAVGGDGTINEVATMVKKYDKILGIIPFGSGNGLARHLKIPMDVSQAIYLLNKLETKRIDTGIFNGKNFYSIAGVGFDAHISLVFATDKRRGLSGYVKLGLKEVFGYKAQNYRLCIDGKSLNRRAYAVSIANSSQYGNNVYISPNASIMDGLLDVCIIKVFPLYKLPVLLSDAFRKRTHKCSMVEIIQGRSVQIVREKSGPVHIDGEPLVMAEEIDVSVEPLSLKIIVPG